MWGLVHDGPADLAHQAVDHAHAQTAVGAGGNQVGSGGRLGGDPGASLERIAARSDRSLGMRVIDSLVRQISGTIVNQAPDSGKGDGEGVGAILVVEASAT